MELIGFLLGTVLGSFVLVLADRGLTNKTFWGRSYCPNCKKNLVWYDLFPIFSYLILLGRCRNCKKRIKLEYLVVELVMGFLIGFLFWQSFQSLQFTPPSWVHSLQTLTDFKFLIFVFELLFKIFFIIVLVALFITDLRKMLIPDRISLPAIKIALVYLFGITIYKVGYLYYFLGQSNIGKLLLPPHSPYFQRHAFITAQPLFGSILSGLGIAGFFMALIILTKGKGMGGGDVKLGGFIGLALGFPQSLLAIVLSFITGAVFSVGLLILGKKRFGQTIPFGPFLVLGSIITLLWGNIIIDWYLNLSLKY